MGTAVGAVIHEWLKRSSQRFPTSRASGQVVMVVAAYVSVVYLVMPANPDPVEVPAALVWWFQVVALLGLILFWVALGGIFVWWLRESPTSSAVRRGLQ